MISKELLSKVLNETVTIVKVPYKDTKRYVYFDLENGKELAINIYELANKCKEWAHMRDYCVNSYKSKTRLKPWEAYISENRKIKILTLYDSDIVYEEELKWFDSTEPEATFKACQWILDND